MAVQPKAKKTAGQAAEGRADAWLNIHITSRQGLRKQLGGIPLDKSKPAQEIFIGLSADELKAAFLKLLNEDRMEFSINSGAGSELEEGDSFL